MKPSKFGSTGDAGSSVLGQMMTQQELMSSGQTSVWQCDGCLLEMS